MKKIWRRGWDLNPRMSCPIAGFQDQCFKPCSATSPKCGYMGTLLYFLRILHNHNFYLLPYVPVMEFVLQNSILVSRKFVKKMLD